MQQADPDAGRCCIIGGALRLRGDSRLLRWLWARLRLHRRLALLLSLRRLSLWRLLSLRLQHRHHRRRRLAWRAMGTLARRPGRSTRRLAWRTPQWTRRTRWLARRTPRRTRRPSGLAWRPARRTRWTRRLAWRTPRWTWRARWSSRWRRPRRRTGRTTGWRWPRRRWPPLTQGAAQAACIGTAIYFLTRRCQSLAFPAGCVASRLANARPDFGMCPDPGRS